jgi:hypothetical protein
MSSVRPLFGGALSCEVPDGFVDVRCAVCALDPPRSEPCTPILTRVTPSLSLTDSTFRQVPDNQEVFAHAATDACVIVELLQYEADVTDADSARHFFDEIAGSNGCGPADVSVLLAESSVSGDKGPKIDAPHTASVIVGDQRVAKFKEGDDAKNVVRVYLGNVRYACPSRWRLCCQSECSSCVPVGVMTRCVRQTAGRDDGRGRLGVGAHAHQPGEQQQRRVPAREQL